MNSQKILIKVSYKQKFTYKYLFSKKGPLIQYSAVSDDFVGIARFEKMLVGDIHTMFLPNSYNTNEIPRTRFDTRPVTANLVLTRIKENTIARLKAYAIKMENNLL